MSNRRDKREQVRRLSKEVPAALLILCKYIESTNELEGSSVMNGVGLIEIRGQEYEIQLRMEKDKELFIGPVSVIETIGQNVPRKHIID